jgi:hypothetical protein
VCEVCVWGGRDCQSGSERKRENAFVFFKWVHIHARAHTRMYTHTCACVRITSTRARSLSHLPRLNNRVSVELYQDIARHQPCPGRRRLHERKKKKRKRTFVFENYTRTSADIRRRVHLKSKACTSASPYTHTNARTHARTHARTNAHTHTHTHTHTHARTHARTHKHTHTWGSTWATRTPRCTSRGKPRTDCRSSANTLRSVSKETSGSKRDLLTR